MAHLSLGLTYDKNQKAFCVVVSHANIDKAPTITQVAQEFHGDTRTAKQALAMACEKAYAVRRAFWAANISVMDNVIIDQNHLGSLTYTLDKTPFPVL